MTPIVTFALIAAVGVLVQSFIGFAGSLVAVPLFAVLLTAEEAIPAYNLLMLVIDVGLVLEGRRHVKWRTVAKLLAGGLVGVPIGACFLKYLPVHVIGLTVSVVTAAFAILFLLKVRIVIPSRTVPQVATGLASGLLGGMISESGPPVVIYGLSRQWPKDEFRGTLLAYFMCLAAMAVASYFALGMYSARNLTWSAAAVVPTAAAALLGTIFKNRVGEVFFRYAILSVIIAVSIVGIAKHAF